jgi:hypothetical protein
MHHGAVQFLLLYVSQSNYNGKRGHAEASSPHPLAHPERERESIWIFYFTELTKGGKKDMNTWYWTAAKTGKFVNV